MPPRVQPKTFAISFKTHKLTVFSSVSQPEKTTIGDLKTEVLDALQAHVLRQPDPLAEDVDMEEDPEWEVPVVESTDEFELSRAIKERGRPTGQYDVLSPKETVKSCLTNWETLFVQFRNPNGGLRPVKVQLAPVMEDDEEELSAVQKGKRKAGPQDFDS